MQSIIQFAVSRKTTILMVIAALLLLGSVSWSRIPVDLLPDITFPAAAVSVNWVGAGPEEVEASVTRILEGSLGTITGIKDVQSISSMDNALIILLFNWGTDMDMAAIEIREKLDMVASLLPDDTSAPTMFKFDPSMLPVMNIALASDSLDLVELNRLGDEVSQRLERIEGVASVSVSGGLEEQVLIAVDGQLLEEYGLTLAGVTNALRLANLSLPGGSISQEGKQWTIRALIRTSVEEMKDLLVGMRTEFIPGQAQPAPLPVTLGEVAKISIEPEPLTSISRINRQRSVSLNLQKQSDANTVITANRVHNELELLKEEYPKVSFVPNNDQSEFIQLAIDSLVKNALLGAVLAMAILLLFLRDFRSTLIVAISIPVSIISTFIMMFFAGLTVNIMTLSGLALGVGMLVDNSIVVIENIFRHLQEKKLPPAQAALAGTKEVAMAITASTLTTVAVFLPVVYVGGIAGILFKELALTVTFSLLASLAVSLTVTPMLASVFARIKKGRISKVMDIASLYRRSLAWTLKHGIVALVVVVLLLAGSLALIPRLGGEFIPAFDEGIGAITVTLGPESALEATENAASQVEKTLLEFPQTQLVATSIGGGGTLLSSFRGSGAVNIAQISFQLVPVEERNMSTAEFIEQVTAALPSISGAEISASTMSSMGGGMLGGGSAIELELAGQELQKLGTYSEDIAQALSRLDFVTDVSTSLGETNPEVQVDIDLAKAAMLGVNPLAVGNSIRSAFQAQTATRLSREGYELNVVVELTGKETAGIDDIGQVVVASQNGMLIRVKDVANVVETSGPRAIRRHNNKRAVTITAEIAESMDLRGAQKAAEDAIADIDLPSSYNLEFQGEIVEMQEAFDGLLLALLLAIALVYMVMASQFESLVHPLIIMFTLPLAAIGVIFTLFITGNNLNIPSMIGIIILAGIVVNNAIVLIDYVNKLRSRGMERDEALLTAGETRLRPILMTTLTTILGLLPLALVSGSGSEMQKPLAVAVVGGLTVSALLTLYIIPLVYRLVDRLFPRATNIQETK